MEFATPEGREAHLLIAYKTAIKSQERLIVICNWNGAMKLLLAVALINRLLGIKETKECGDRARTLC